MDLYNIPGDTGKNWRLNKYCEYQATVPPINPITYTEYARKNKLSKDDCVYLGWLNSTCYSAETAIFMFNQLPLKDLNGALCKGFWEKYKSYLYFISARQYAKNMDWFVPLVKEFVKIFGKSPYNKIKSMLTSDAEENYDKLFNLVNSLKFMGRFSTDLFLESLVHMSYHGLLDFNLEYPDFSWKNGSNITSAIFNIFYEDEKANSFDKYRTVSKEEEIWLNKKLQIIQKAIQEKYPEQNSDISEITPKLCSFRNLFKGSRYGGFHHDRQLEILNDYKKTLPEFNCIWDELFEIRKSQFNEKLLGELNGWNGIRKDRKKLFLTQGLTGIEGIIDNKNRNRLLVNIRGCNGSGKSTIPMSMMNDPEMYVIEKPYKGKQKKILTVFPTYGWITLGTYFNKTGGVDVFPNNELTQKALWYALKKFPEYDIMMEGVIASTIRSTYVNLFHEVEEKCPDINIIIMNFVPPFEVCLDRIQKRNGGKPIKEEAVRNKWKIVNRNVQAFKDEGFVSIKIDTSKIPKEDMFHTFEEKIEKYKGGL